MSPALNKPSFDDLFGAALDITAPEHVEVVISQDRKTLWVNVNGVCAIRCCRIGHLTADFPLSVLSGAKVGLYGQATERSEGKGEPG